jgi:hypothetical protein
MRFCRDVSPDDAVDPLAWAMGRPESARPLDRLDDVTLNRTLPAPVPAAHACVFVAGLSSADTGRPGRQSGWEEASGHEMTERGRWADVSLASECPERSGVCRLGRQSTASGPVGRSVVLVGGLMSRTGVRNDSR